MWQICISLFSDYSFCRYREEIIGCVKTYLTHQCYTPLSITNCIDTASLHTLHPLQCKDFPFLSSDIYTLYSSVQGLYCVCYIDSHFSTPTRKYYSFIIFCSFVDSLYSVIESNIFYRQRKKQPFSVYNFLNNVVQLIGKIQKENFLNITLSKKIFIRF